MVRSPVDLLRAVVATATLVAFLLLDRFFGAAVIGFGADLLGGLDALGDAFATGLAVVVRVGTLVLLAGGFVRAALGGRWRMLLTTITGVAVGLVPYLAFSSTVAGEHNAVTITIDGNAGVVSTGSFPSGPGLTIITAVVAASSPWLSRRSRRLSWLLVLGLATVRLLTDQLSGDSVLAVLAGWVGGSAALVILGGPTRRPTRDAVMAGLASVGVDLVELEPASVDARGSTPYFGVQRDGAKLFVKALGEDERDADLLFRIYRYVVPRHLGDERPFSTLRRAVEHEALVALMAIRLGVRTPAVAAFADAEPNAFVLSYEQVAGRSLDRVELDEMTDDLMDRIWGQFVILREHRIAHRDLRLANMFLDDDGQVWIIDFGFSELAANDLLLANDLAELVTSFALSVGAERAVAAARGAIGAEALATALPRLKPGYLSGAGRTGLKEQSGLLEDLRGRIAS